MRVSVLILFLLLLGQSLFAQNRLKVSVINADDHQPLVGANVYFDSLQIGASTDADGLARIEGIPDGRYRLTVSYVGYRTKNIPLHFPNIKYKHPLTVLLEPAPFSSEQIVVTSTRNNSVLAKTPVRIQVLGKEEVHEEIAIQPGNLSKFLGESSSIITRQTSAVSGAISFRLQGLPARYTQLLKDGFPDFSGLVSGFSLLQIPPLDLQQIEITRGSYSTLFANGAVAGIVNLVSRKPAVKPHWDLLFNRTNLRGTDISSFYSAGSGRAGWTLLSSQSLQNAVDVNNDGFSDIPQFRQTTLNPRFIYDFDESTSLMISLKSFFENRLGGDMKVINSGADSTHIYIEKYHTARLGLNLSLKKQFTDSASLAFKTSYQDFNQNAALPGTYFSGKQKFGFAELSCFKPVKNHKWVGGISFIHREFKQQNKKLSAWYDNRFTTFSLFAQDDWTVTSKWTAHGGLRWDYRSGKRSFLLPHAALLFNAGRNLKLRLSGGFGYSMPDLHDVAPTKAYYTYHISPLSKLHAEQSRDISFDATYHYIYGEMALSLNQVFYATWIDQAQFPGYPSDGAPLYIFSNPLTARGAETHLVTNFDTWELFIDYNYVDVWRSLTGKREILPFTPKQKLNITVTYEQEGNWRTGLEGFYTGRQFLEDGHKGRDYFIFGVMFEKKLSKFSLILNVENVLDERQSKYGPIVSGSLTNPDFKNLYMPIEGRVANLVLWLKL